MPTRIIFATLSSLFLLSGCGDVKVIEKPAEKKEVIIEKPVEKVKETKIIETK